MFVFSHFLILHLLVDSKNGRKPIVGVAHHVSFTRPYGLFDVAAVTLANSLTLFPYIDSICDKLDFIGINYYGQVAYTSFNDKWPKGPNMLTTAVDTPLSCRRLYQVLV